ncbi:MAG: hypothetical protein HRU51_04995 [Xanthomonadales bacterium]|nr:hypothetical protein [Xanthomonadales bacterium]
MAHQYFLRAVVLCCCLLPAVHLLADLSTAAADFSRYAEQTSFELSDGRAAERQIAEAFDQRFADQLNPESLAGADDEALMALFEALETLQFWVPSREALGWQKQVLLALEKKAGAAPQHYAALQKAMIRLREFPEARAYGQRYEALDLAPVPRARPLASEQPGSRYWTVSEGGAALIQMRASPGPGEIRVVVAFHPSCRFSRQAWLTLAADEDLSRSDFFAHSLWLIPPSDRFLSGQELASDMLEPPLNWAYAHSKTDWPQVDLGQVPTLQVFDAAGQLLGRMTGWPVEPERQRDQLQELKQLLRTAGQL